MPSQCVGGVVYTMKIDIVKVNSIDIPFFYSQSNVE